MIEYIHSSAMTSTMLTPMAGTQCKGLGKILGLVVGVVASIAVPFLAPGIGAALGGGFFASVAGQSLIGAGIGALGGAAGSALGGGDILRGALLGGAGGALAGGAAAYGSGQGFLTESVASATARNAANTAASGFQISQIGGAGTSTGVITGVNATTGLPLATAGAAGAAGALAASPETAATMTPALAGAPAAATATPGILGGMSTGFKTAAIQSLLSGGTQLLQSMGPDAQADIFKKMQAEMEVTRTQDAAAYAAQKKIFDEYYNFAKGINPEFFGQLERSNEQIRLSSTWGDTERNLRQSGATPVAIAAERRRMEIEGSAGLNTAHASGFMTGLNSQGSAYRIASSLHPTTPTGYSQNLNNMYDAAGTQAKERADGIAGLVSPWSVYAQDRAKNPQMYKTV